MVAIITKQGSLNWISYPSEIVLTCVKLIHAIAKFQDIKWARSLMNTSNTAIITKAVKSRQMCWTLFPQKATSRKFMKLIVCFENQQLMRNATEISESWGFNGHEWKSKIEIKLWAVPLQHNYWSFYCPLIDPSVYRCSFLSKKRAFSINDFVLRLLQVNFRRI